MARSKKGAEPGDGTGGRGRTGEWGGRGPVPGPRPDRDRGPFPPGGAGRPVRRLPAGTPGRPGAGLAECARGVRSAREGTERRHRPAGRVDPARAGTSGGHRPPGGTRPGGIWRSCVNWPATPTARGLGNPRRGSGPGPRRAVRECAPRAPGRRGPRGRRAGRQGVAGRGPQPRWRHGRQRGGRGRGDPGQPCRGRWAEARGT